MIAPLLAIDHCASPLNAEAGSAVSPQDGRSLVNTSTRPRPPGVVAAGTIETQSRRRPLAGLVASLVLVAAVGFAWVAQQPPPAVPASAPATEFSAERAGEHLRRIAGDQPTPIGSAGSDEVRDYLVAELSALGFAVEVQAGVGVYTSEGTTDVGRVENVVATLPGRDSTGRVVLAAHYDTTFGSPGAADDKAAVAAILEAGRALTSSEPLRNDVVVLLTDGEEPGMLGAASFVAEHPYGTEGGVVLNWEAAGNAGPSVLFETSPGNAGLIAEFAASAPHPAGDSAMAAVYDTASQNTDFTVFSDHGFTGLNFALIDGVAAYHHSSDTVDNLDPASLQHHGANMLGLARGFGERDLAHIRSENDATYFTMFGQVIAYPASLIWPLAGLALAAVIALAIVARRRGLATMPRMLAGAAASVVPIVAAPAAAIGLWEALVGIRPGYATMFMGDPYRPQLYRWAIGALTATILLTWYLTFRRRVGAVPLAVGALVWPAVSCVGTAWLLPAASYSDALSVVAAAGGGALALVVGERRPGWRAAALTAGVIPGVVLYVLAGRALLGVLGIDAAALGVFQFVFAGLVALPLGELALPLEQAGSARPVARRRAAPVPFARRRAALVPVARRRAALVPVTTAVLTVALTCAGLAVDRFDEDHPQQSHLMYVLDAGASTAMWASEDHNPHAWVARYAGEPNGDMPPGPLPYATRPRWTGTADVLPLDAPQFSLLDSRTDGDAIVMELQVASSRDAEEITLHVDRPVEAVTIAANGHAPVTSTPSYPDDAGSREWPYELRFYDPPRDGIRVTLRLQGTKRPRISLSDYTVGLEQIPGFTPRPPHLDRSPDHSSDLLVVRRTHEP
jgi:hypothetical protein